MTPPEVLMIAFDAMEGEEEDLDTVALAADLLVEARGAVAGSTRMATARDTSGDPNRCHVGRWPALMSSDTPSRSVQL